MGIVYSGVPNNRVDRLVCGKPFSHRQQTYLEWFSVSKCVGWDKKKSLPFAVWPFVVDLLYLKSNEISAKCIYSASKYKSFSFLKLTPVAVSNSWAEASLLEGRGSDVVTRYSSALLGQFTARTGWSLFITLLFIVTRTSNKTKVLASFILSTLIFFHSNLTKWAD